MEGALHEGGPCPGEGESPCSGTLKRRWVKEAYYLICSETDQHGWLVPPEPSGQPGPRQPKKHERPVGR